MIICQTIIFTLFSTSRMHYVKHIEIHKKHIIRDCVIVYTRDQTEHTIIKWSHYYKNVFTVDIKCFLNSFLKRGKTEVEVEVETEAKNAQQMLNAKSVKYIYIMRKKEKATESTLTHIKFSLNKQWITKIR